MIPVSCAVRWRDPPKKVYAALALRELVARIPRPSRLRLRGRGHERGSSVSLGRASGERDLWHFGQPCETLVAKAIGVCEWPFLVRFEREAFGPC